MSNTCPQTMHLGDVQASCGSEVVELFSTFFSSVFQSCQNIPSTTAPLVESNFVLSRINISLDEIKLALLGLDEGKGAGADGIPALFFKNCAQEVAPVLHTLYNKSLRTGIFPDLWKIAHITPIYKYSNKSHVKNYRPISILPCLGKVFEKLTYKTFFSHFKHILCQRQYGFVQSRSITGNLIE